MARTETFTKLLDRCSTPVQTDIILAQLKLLRRQDRQNREVRRLDERGSSTFTMIALMVVATFMWAAMAKVIAAYIALALPFGH